MSTHPTPRPQREIIDFPPNIPVTVSLKYTQPRMVSNQHGERAMFTTPEDRVIFLDPPVAAQIAQLGVNVREPFTITRRCLKAGAPMTWEVARIPAATPATGEQPDGTFAVPKLPEPKPVSRASLVDEANALIDAWAQVLSRTLERHEGRVKPDEARSLFVSAYIQRGKVA